MVLADMARTFVEGLLTPLGAVCVLPLYPGFIVYLSNRIKEGDKNLPVKLSLLVAAGVITFMFLLGIIFTTLLKVSLSRIVGILSPIAFGILAVISIMLLFNMDFSRFMPKFDAPKAKNPLLEAYLFGFFFGLIVIPCNPAFIALFFADILATASGFATNMLRFLAFALGLAAPLIGLTLMSAPRSKQIISYFTRHQKRINQVAGVIMLVISIYYLVFVFRVFG